MKRILVGLIALGLAMGLMFGCVLNPGETVEITTENGVLAETGAPVEDVVITLKDANGNVTKQWIWGADGTWTYETYAYESKDGDASDQNNNGTNDEGVWYQSGGFKGTYSWDAEAGRLTMAWNGNVYAQIDNVTNGGFAWSGDWSSTNNFNGITYYSNGNTTEGNAGFVLEVMSGWVDFSDPSLSVIDGDGDGTTGNTMDDFLYTAFTKGYVEGTLYYETASVDPSTTATELKLTKTRSVETLAIDAAAMTLSYTYMGYGIDTAGTVTATPGSVAGWVFEVDNVRETVEVDNTATADPTDTTYVTSSSDKDIDAMNTILTVDLKSELQDTAASTTSSGATHTLVLDAGDYEDTGGWNNAGLTNASAFSTTDVEYYYLGNGNIVPLQ